MREWGRGAPSPLTRNHQPRKERLAEDIGLRRFIRKNLLRWLAGNEPTDFFLDLIVGG
jgi:hypothetical protein